MSLGAATNARDGWEEGVVETPLGRMHARISPRGIRSLRWDEDGGGAGQEGPIFCRLREEIATFFEGRLREFEVPLDLEGTPFQISVWRALRSIPYGRTLTYGELAAEIGRPAAARAVGQANRANPLPLLVPCHRVVASTGLGGYAGSGERGLERKRRLLRLEGSLLGS